MIKDLRVFTLKQRLGVAVSLEGLIGCKTSCWWSLKVGSKPEECGASAGPESDF